MGWANILGALFAGVGFLLVVWDRRKGRELNPTEAADVLCQAVLTSEGQLRRRLLYAGGEKRTTANITFESDHLVRYSVLQDAGNPGGLGVSEGDLAGIGAFYRSTPGRLLILGEPGAGKTVLLIDLLLQMCEHRATLEKSARETTPVPVRFSLPTWNVNVPLAEWLAESLSLNFSITQEAAKELLERRLIVPFLDGLDEMDAPGDEYPRADRALQMLNEYVMGRVGAPLVVTCRTADAAALGTHLSDAVTIRISPLSTSQIREYMRAELAAPGDTEPLAAWNELMARSDAGTILAALDTPWMLNLAVTRLRDERPPSWPLPADAASDYRSELQHDLLSGFIHARTRADTTQPYSPEQVQHWSRSIARHLGDGANIELQQLWSIGGDKAVRRTHAAVNTAVALVLVVGMVLSVNRLDPGYMIARTQYWIEQFPDVPVLLEFLGLLILMSMTVMIARRGALRELDDPEPISFHQLRTTRGRSRLLRGLAFGLVAGLLLGLIIGGIMSATYGTATGFDDRVATDVFSSWLVFGLLAGLILSLELGLSPAGPWDLRPEEALRTDVVKAASYGLASGLVGAFVLRAFIGTSFVAALWGAMALAGFWVAAMNFGQTSLRYGIGISYAASRGRLPLRTARFLNWGCQAGIYRQTGSSYQFRHLQLRDHLQAEQRAVESAVASRT